MDADTNTAEADAFLTWFKTNGGSVHPAVGITTFPTMGRGVVALQDIEKDTVLFTVPRSITLSIRTSSLPSKFGEHEWKKHQLHKGWVGLILCMLWEDAAGKDGMWSCYLSSLPERFQTPMFWEEKDLQELQGTSIFDKIGRIEAEQDYHKKLLPAVLTRPDLFPTRVISSHYSLHRYHVMGSRILSRSFHVEQWIHNTLDSDGIQYLHDGALERSDDMDIDIANHHTAEQVVQQDRDKDEASSDSEGDEDPGGIAMVPLADVLNARYGSDNAKLCYESADLQMICTQDIRSGDQIWNTYGNLPNCDLLRRYGHVDVIPTSGGILGNPADIVEIRADVLLDVLNPQMASEKGDLLIERIEWWLDEGGDDRFTLDTTFTLPGDFISLIRLLTMPMDEWINAKDRHKIPKPKEDAGTLRLAQAVCKKKLGDYKTTLEEDEAFLGDIKESSSPKYMATVVRVGEKRILKGVMDEVMKKLDSQVKDSKTKQTGKNNRERPNKRQKL